MGVWVGGGEVHIDMKISEWATVLLSGDLPSNA